MSIKKKKTSRIKKHQVPEAKVEAGHCDKSPHSLSQTSSSTGHVKGLEEWPLTSGFPEAFSARFYGDLPASLFHAWILKTETGPQSRPPRVSPHTALTVYKPETEGGTRVERLKARAMFSLLGREG